MELHSKKSGSSLSFLVCRTIYRCLTFSVVLLVKSCSRSTDTKDNVHLCEYRTVSSLLTSLQHRVKKTRKYCLLYSVLQPMKILIFFNFIANDLSNHRIKYSTLFLSIVKKPLPAQCEYKWFHFIVERVN